MYSSEEAKQYSKLKDDPEFQKQCDIEWLKLVFTPLSLRQDATEKLTSPSCDPRLRDAPKFLEERRQSLLNAAIQVNRFREIFSNDSLQKETLDKVKKELEANLSPEELAMVNNNWDKTLNDAIAKTNQVTACEKIVADLGYNQLLAAIERTGVSFSPNRVDAEFEQKLKKALTLTSGQSSKNLCDKLNNEFGLSISEKDALAIKQEIYIKEISKSAPGLAKILTEKLQKLHTTTGTTYDVIKKLNKALEQYKDSPTNKTYLKRSIERLRKLGVGSKAIPDTELEALINEDCHPIRSRNPVLSWQQQEQTKPNIKPQTKQQNNQATDNKLIM